MSKEITLKERRDIMRAMIYSCASPTDVAVRWIPPNVALLSKLEIEKLPTPTERLTDSGVYFLWRGADLIYIGSSENVHVRVTAHLNGNETAFTSANFLAVQSPWHLALEALYIREYRPRLNRQFLK